MKAYGHSQELITEFQGQDFSNKALIYNFYLKINEPGAHDFLVQRLQSLRTHKFQQFLPQLVFICIKLNVPKLQKFLINKCSSNLQNFSLIHQYLLAFSEIERKDSKKQKQLKMFLSSKALEMSLVNGVTDQEELQLASEEMNDHQFRECIIIYVEIFLKKAHMSEYVNEAQKFIRSLIKLSLQLKSIDQQLRKEYLNDCIRRGNRIIRTLREIHKEISLFFGIFLAFQKKKSDRHESNIIVNIIEDDTTCFNTKMRVPYRIIVETVNYDDIGKYSMSNIQLPQSICNLDEDLVDMKQTDEDVEKLMKQMAQSKILFDYDISALKRLAQLTYKRQVSVISSVRSLDQDIKFERQSSFRSERQSSIISEQQIKSIDSIFDKFRSKKNNYDKFDVIHPKQKLIRRKSESSNNEEGFNIFQKTQQSPVKERRLSYTNKKDRVQLSEDFITYVESHSTLRIIRSQVYTNFNKIKSPINQIQPHSTSPTPSNYNESEESGMNQLADSFGPWEEVWEDKAAILRQQSPFRNFPSYRLRQIIVKGGDDLRQELLAMQIITKMQRIFIKERLKIYLRPYEIIITSTNSGIVEFIPNTLSLDALKKKVVDFVSMDHFYRKTYGRDFELAQKNFVESLAGYSLVQYLLQIKDRHNGNILIDNLGHIIHIDFGFMFGVSPGNINFESAPFKLTNEYVQLLEGIDSGMFMYFKTLLFQGLLVLRNYINEITLPIQMLMEGKQTDLMCFKYFSMIEFKKRFMTNSTEAQIFSQADQLISQSLNNWSTSQYDKFQSMTNKIMQ